MYYAVYNICFFKAYVGSFEPVICALCDYKMGTLSFEDKQKPHLFLCHLMFLYYPTALFTTANCSVLL